ncbi:GerAB/ArcD/ProY family transporter [Bacillus sp. FJAT-18017]|uniref:GerAB/ArcD/ProY family transporter n=1 Tax=Bacillus sp. FJAT-18017 TaxID=1705566 RepID=UPI000A584E7D|nr:GerAB/ArcD/ProY family transporter [Bacillus sp. FJAT-18017]
MTASVPEKAKVSTFLTFFLVHKMQWGIGVLGFQRIIAKYAGYDAWISVLLAGLVIHPLIWMLYKMTSVAGGDIVSIHEYTLGKKIGKWASLPFVIYFSLLSITTLRTFIEIIQVWMFQDISTFGFALPFMILAIYIVSGGFRTVAGIAFFGVILPFYMIFVFFYTLPYANFNQLLPILEHSFKDLALSSFNMSLTFIGWELLLIYYPFIKNPEKSQKFAHWGVLFTTLGYTFISLISFIYYSEGQLERTVWATLSIFKIVELPFVERFEFVGLASWNLIILPNVCLGLWGASRVLKRAFRIKQKVGIYIISLLILIACSLISGRADIDMLNSITGRVGFFVNFGYIPLLFLATLISRKVKENAKQ